MGKHKPVEEGTQQLYEFIAAFKLAHNGIAPSFREMSKATGISISKMRAVLEHLVETGKIAFYQAEQGGISRAIIVPALECRPCDRQEVVISS